MVLLQLIDVPVPVVTASPAEPKPSGGIRSLTSNRSYSQSIVSVAPTKYGSDALGTTIEVKTHPLYVDKQNASALFKNDGQSGLLHLKQVKVDLMDSARCFQKCIATSFLEVSIFRRGSFIILLAFATFNESRIGFSLCLISGHADIDVSLSVSRAKEQTEPDCIQRGDHRELTARAAVIC